MERQFDVVVIGTGVTSAVASRCREAGWSVGVVDSRPFGGTCALRGCIPKKTLVGAAEAVHAARDLADRGVPARALAIDWPTLMRFKRSLIDSTTERTEQAWAKMGVEQFHGRETDMAVHSAGRVPELDDLHLETAGVKREKRGVVVNQFLQSVSNPAVYAGGDAAASGPPLTPKADHDTGVLTTNLLEGNRRTPNYDGIASAVFSLPPLASAGLTEAAAHGAGLTFRTSWQDMSGWFNTRRVGETTAGSKVLIEQGTDRIVGAHLLGPHADEVINLFAMAIRLRIPAGELEQALYAYPTYGSDIRFMV